MVLEVLESAIRQEKERKDPQTKEEDKHSLLADDVILYIKKPKGLHQKLARTDKSTKVTGYKINIQKSVALLYTNMKHQKEKSRN